MTELSFLLDLLMNHRLQKATKEIVAQRIKEVEESLNQKPQVPFQPKPIVLPPNLAGQSPSTLALMAKHGDLPPIEPIVMPEIPPVTPNVTAIAQNHATQLAMESRQQAIRTGMSGKPISGETKPRKW